MRTLQTTTEHGNIMYSDTVCYTGTCDAAPVPVHQQPRDAGAHGHGRLPAPAPAAHWEETRRDVETTGHWLGTTLRPDTRVRHFMELCWEARCCVTSYLPHKHAFVSSVDMYLHIYNGFPYRQKCWEIDNMYRYVFWLHKDVRQYIIAALVEFHFNVFLQVLVDIHIYVTEL